MDGGAFPEEIDGAVLVNQAELARAFDVSTTTIQDWLKHEDFPIAERGGNGRAWSFRLKDVWNWREGRQKEEAEIQAKRDEAVAQLRLQITGGGGSSLPTQLSAADRIKEMQAEASWMAMARQRRELIPAKEVQIGLERLLLQFGSIMDAMPDVLADELGLNTELQERVADICDRKRRDLHTEMLKLGYSASAEAA